MSFKPIRTVYNLTFKQYPGLHVKMHSAVLGEIMSLSMGIDPSNITDEQKTRSFEFLESKLIEWDIQHPELLPDKMGVVPTHCPCCGLREDDSLPPTMAGILCLEAPFVLDILNGYNQTVGEPSPKASQPPNVGATPETLRRLAERQNPLK
jgi:hypothetical protein